MLTEFVIPSGIDLAPRFAIESNPLTRKMYARIGVAAAPYSARLVSRLEAVK